MRCQFGRYAGHPSRGCPASAGNEARCRRIIPRRSGNVKVRWPPDHVRLSLGCRLFGSIERSISGVQQALSQGSKGVGQMIGALIAQRSRRIHVLSQELFRAIQPPGEFLFACLSVRPNSVHQTVPPGIGVSRRDHHAPQGRPLTAAFPIEADAEQVAPPPSPPILSLPLIGDLLQYIVFRPRGRLARRA